MADRPRAEVFSGKVQIQDSAARTTIELDGQEGDITVSRTISGVRREVMKLDASHAALYIGSQGDNTDGDIIVHNNSGDITIQLDGQEGNIQVTGDIRLTNADCAEDFDICATEQIDPGTVMVLG